MTVNVDYVEINIYEHGGKNGRGTIVANYYNSYKYIYVGVYLQANVKGYFTYDICNLDKFGYESEECFAENKLMVIGGGLQFKMTKYVSGWFNTSVNIPNDLVCNH